MPDVAKDGVEDVILEDVILGLCGACAPGRTLSPADVAKVLVVREGREESAWRSRLGAVRRAAARLAEAGRITVYRKGKPAEPRSFKGVYRLGPRR